MFIRRVTIFTGLLAVWLSAASPLCALTLDEAKAKGLVGEKASGYLGAVNSPSGEVQALLTDVNQKRRQAYEEIARRNGTSLSAVEILAGEKAVENTKAGHYVEGPGGWKKK